VKYFAYGSNMPPEEMARLCPSAQFVAVARLPGYRLDFTRFSRRYRAGVADIVPDGGSHVWGVVYELDERELGPLDEKEGVAMGAYRRIEVHVETDGTAIRAMAYEVVEKSAPVRPAASYLKTILTGARHWRLPEEYVRRVEEYGKRLGPVSR